MLTDLHVRDLGVIEDLALEFAPGMTALTGETGAGKTLVVEALQLVLGGRANPGMVRAGAAEALVEARFVVGQGDAAHEVILTRSVPAAGRSRAWVDGRMAPLGALGEAAALLDVDQALGIVLPALDLVAQAAGQIGQLDGGHISYAVLGRRSTYVTLAMIGVAIVLSFLSASWIVWTVLMVVMLFAFGHRHPRTVDEDVPLDRPRLILAIFAAVMFALCFTPVPLEKLVSP